MTPLHLIAALEATGLTQTEIGAHVGVTRQSVNAWKAGRVPIPKAARIVFEIWLKERMTK